MIHKMMFKGRQLNWPFRHAGLDRNHIILPWTAENIKLHHLKNQAVPPAASSRPTDQRTTCGINGFGLQVQVSTWLVLIRKSERSQNKDLPFAPNWGPLVLIGVFFPLFWSLVILGEKNLMDRFLSLFYGGFQWVGNGPHVWSNSTRATCENPLAKKKRTLCTMMFLELAK